MLPYPAIGTRLVFQLVCPDLRNPAMHDNALPRYITKDVGSIVIGGDEELGGSAGNRTGPPKNLRDMRFMTGDFVSCAILPPLPDGSVAPASAARRERPLSGNHRGFGRGGMYGRERESNRGAGVGWGSRQGGAFANVPMGEWKRGQALPNMPPLRPRGGRW